MMEAALVMSASKGAMKPLLSKLTKLLGHEYVKLKGMTKQIKLLRDELSAMSATLQMLEDAEEELNPQMKDWRDKLRELAYDTEDCIDAFMARVDLGLHESPTGFHRKLKKLKAGRGIADEIKDLKARAEVAGEGHRRYSLVDPASNYSSSAIDPRLPALYEEFNNLVGINGKILHIIEWLDMDSSPELLKLLPIAGCGGLGKTTLANQVYHTVKSKFFSERQSQFSCTAFVTVSRNPNVRKILRDIAEEIGITDNTPNDDERQLINKLRRHLQDKRPEMETPSKRYQKAAPERRVLISSSVSSIYNNCVSCHYAFHQTYSSSSPSNST